MKQQADKQVVYIEKQPVLQLKQGQGSIELINEQVPYTMMLSSIENTLADRRKSYAMKHLPSENAAPMAVGIQFSVGLSALGCELNQIKQALQQPQQTLSLRDDLIADRDVWVGQHASIMFRRT